MSETTKRIATYLYENQPECLTAIARERRAEACFDIAEVLATHLHQEVIRGKIEELNKWFYSSKPSVPYFTDRLADLERQIKEQS